MPETTVIAMVALAASQTGLLTTLLVQGARRRRAELALRKSEAALRQSNVEAHNLAGRLISAQESERRRIARDLHDNLSQKLALLCIEIGRLSVRASVSAAAIPEAVAHLSERARDIAGDVRYLSHDLHPPRLELVGLAPAIEGLCRDMSRQYDVRIEFRQEAVSRSVPADAALCFFRVTQEALQNVVKHSGARTATVRLAQTRQDLRPHIADSGQGFDRAANDGVGLGLLSMRERVHFAAGRILIRSVPGRGTHVVVTLPNGAGFRRHESQIERVAPPLTGPLTTRTAGIGDSAWLRFRGKPSCGW